MKKQILLVIAGLGVAVLVAAPVSAQPPPRMTMNVTFAFTAGTTALPAGQYIVERDSPEVIHIHSMDPTTKPKALVMVQTRLSRLSEVGRAAIVFDHMGDKYVLSEVWFPGEDGYLLFGTSASHTHEIVKGK